MELPNNDFNDLDRIIHEPARLQILSILFQFAEADFLFLLNITGLTKGNLSSHISKLEAAGYVEVKKTFVAKQTRTVLAITEKGKDGFKEYHNKMSGLLNKMLNRKDKGKQK